ncbi:MAG: transporter associated domain-containing protein, partial [Pseudomonadota bacterium]
TLRLFGARIQAQLGLSTTPEELRGVIDLHRGPEPEIRDERAMLRSILELGDVEAGEIMTHRSNTGMVDLDKNNRTNVQQVLSSPFTRLPVYRGNPDNIVGVIHAKDLLRAFQKAKGDMTKLEIEKIASPPWFIPESTSLLDQLRAFRDRREHFAIVVDEYGSFMGVVTLEDILEEIVGEITDEHDQVVPGVSLPGVRPQPNGSYIVNGDVTIRDLNREFEWDLPDDEAATVAGLVMHEARRIPEVKQVFAFHGFRFEILRRDQNRITSLRISRLDANDGGPGSGKA